MTQPADEIIGTIALGDVRRERRLQHLVNTITAQPGLSLPKTFSAWADLVAAYRFFRNPAIDAGTIRTAIAATTAARCRECAFVLAVQDSTSLDFTTHRKLRGVGPLEHPKHQGIWLHSTLAVNEAGVPLGLLDQQVWVRDPETVGHRDERHDLPIEAKESAKWLRGLQATEALVGADTRVLTVADREADVYELFALAQVLRGDWLIRARHDRKVDGDLDYLVATVAAAPLGATLTVTLPRADDHPARETTLAIRWVRVTMVPPKRPKQALAAWWAAHPDVEPLVAAPLVPLPVSVIQVTELTPPDGSPPVEWLLLTNLPVTTAAEARECVRFYRLRWLIERYHYVLKSGCRVERLQQEDLAPLLVALAVFSGVAWWLLWVTYAARAEPTAPCTVVFDQDTWEALAVAHQQPIPDTPPDLRTAVRQIAKLGGFLGRKGDGAPGVQTLWTGLMRLHAIVTTWRYLKHHPHVLTQHICSV